MYFNEKLKELRKNKNITQDELAEKLYVSRTAVSKWESGKGYPSIETLKDLAKFYDISIDDLLSNDELIDISIDNMNKERKNHLYFMFGLFDLFVLLMLFIPLFGYDNGSQIISISLINPNMSLLPKIIYYFVLGVIILMGLIILVLVYLDKEKLLRYLIIVSLILGVILVAAFLVTREPYAGITALSLGVIKAIMYIKYKKWIKVS